jgi:hypothetical protein
MRGAREEASQRRRRQGRSGRAIAEELGVGEGTVRRAALPCAKNVSEIGMGSALVSRVA